MPDGLYDRDFLLWLESQAALLRRLAAGERVNEAIDWPCLIQEVEDLGRSELRACESLPLQALIHLANLQAWPGSLAASQWRAETAVFLADARRRFSPAVREWLELEELYREACQAVRLETGDSAEAAALPKLCPFGLDDLLAREPCPLLAGSGG